MRVPTPRGVWSATEGVLGPRGGRAGRAHGPSARAWLPRAASCASCVPRPEVGVQIDARGGLAGAQSEVRPGICFAGEDTSIGAKVLGAS